MRPIEDLSVFLDQKVSVERSDGNGYVVYACGKDKWEEIHWKHFTEKPRPVIYSTFCSIMLWNEFRYIRRIRQPFLSIEYILEGELWLRSGKRAFAAEKGDLCLLHRYGNYDYYFRPRTPTRLMTFVLHGSALDSVLRILQLDRREVFFLPQKERLQDLFDRLKVHVHERSRGARSDEINSGLSFELLQFLSNAGAAQEIPESMRRIRDYLEETMTEELKIEDLTKRFSCSLPTLNREFRRCFGMTPYHYRLERKMRKAEELLMQTDLPVKEIAFQLGYGKPLYFSAEFIRLRGISPQKFRREKR